MRDFDGGHAQPLAGHLAALVLPDGRRIEYGYDPRGNLAEARFDDGTARTYHYEDPVWPHHLTGLTERTGTRFATWAYDERGRAVLSEHADGVERVTLVHDAPHDRGEAVGALGTTTVTDSLGASSVYTWRRHPGSGASLLLSATGPGCATCPPTGRRYGYDDEGRLSSVVRLDDDGNALSERHYAWAADGRLASLHERGEDGIERLIERREYAAGTQAAGTQAAGAHAAGAHAAAADRPVLIARPSVNPDGERTLETVTDAAGRPVAIVERGYAPDPAVASGTAPTAFVPIERTTRLGYADGHLVTIDGPARRRRRHHPARARRERTARRPAPPGRARDTAARPRRARPPERVSPRRGQPVAHRAERPRRHRARQSRRARRRLRARRRRTPRRDHRHRWPHAAS